MYGFENITANNGWAMAVIGATIVFAGLVVLSFAISQIHKVLALWDKRVLSKERQKRAPALSKAQMTREPTSKVHHLPSVRR